MAEKEGDKQRGAERESGECQQMTDSFVFLSAHLAMNYGNMYLKITHIEYITILDYMPHYRYYAATPCQKVRVGIYTLCQSFSNIPNLP